VYRPGRPIRAGIHPTGFPHQLVPLDPRAEQLARPDFARDRLIRHDADPEPGLHHRLDDLDVFGVHHDVRRHVLAQEETVDLADFGGKIVVGGKPHLGDGFAFLRRVPSHVCVILDEAYCEFALTLGDTYASLELLRKHPNLVLLRTFSKVYGLAGLRVGYALCGAEDFRIAVDQVRQPFYLNSAAQAAAVEALRHQDEVERRVTETIGNRIEMADGVRALGLWVAESDANFIWLHLPEDVEEAEVVSDLRDRGVLVRAGAALGRDSSLRVTIGTPPENERFVEALKASLASLTASGTKRGR